MARIFSSGYELNSTSAGVEWTTLSGSPTVDTATDHTGAYALRATNGGAVTGLEYQFSAADQTASFFIRAYILIAVLPSAACRIIQLRDSSSGAKVAIQLNTDGTLQLRNDEDSANVGSASSALSLNTWYRLELSCDTTTIAATTVDARINGVSFASSSIDLLNGTAKLRVGMFTNAVTHDFYFDDIALNDSSGSFQNSWPGGGNITHLRPASAGDSGAWTGDNTDIDEVTPDDTTTKLSSNTLDQIEEVNVDDTSSLMSARSDINVVAIGCRFNGVGASSNASFVLRVKSLTGGTVEESSAITPTSTTWVTNAAAVPRTYALTLYDVPGAATTKWKKFDLDTAQIGVRLSATSTNAAQISTLWMLVDSNPTPLVLNNYQSVSASSSNAGIISVAERVW